MLCKLSYLRRKAFEIHSIVSSYVIMRRVEKSNSAKKEEVRSRMAKKNGLSNNDGQSQNLGQVEGVATSFLVAQSQRG
jgi:hypothetical protein